MHIHTALIEHLRDNSDRRSLVFYRSDSEMKALNEWLTPSGKGPAIPAPTVEGIASMIRGCTKCRDIHEKKPGFGPGSNGVMILLNAPQMIKQSEKDRMKKDSIEMMKRMMKAIDVDFEQCYITNLYKCESSTMKPSDLYKNCASILQHEVENTKTPYGYCYGGTDTAEKNNGRLPASTLVLNSAPHCPSPEPGHEVQCVEHTSVSERIYPPSGCRRTEKLT